MEHKRTCVVCGAEYSYCTGCADYAQYPKWMAVYHDKNCRSIYHALAGYMSGRLTKEQAKSQLGNTQKVVLVDGLRKVYNEIMGITEQPKPKFEEKKEAPKTDVKADSKNDNKDKKTQPVPFAAKQADVKKGIFSK